MKSKEIKKLRVSNEMKRRCWSIVNLIYICLKFLTTVPGNIFLDIVSFQLLIDRFF